MTQNAFGALQSFRRGKKEFKFYSLAQLEKQGIGKISRLPVSLRVVLESVLRNVDGKKVSESNVHELANWRPTADRETEIPFMVARILLQDFTGVPLLVDLAAMRSAVERMGKDPAVIEPLVPVDLVIDHSVQVDFWSRSDAIDLNMQVEFLRNRSRYQFLKWGTQAFDNFRVVPSGIGIVHQVNLEYLARGVLERQGVLYFDTLVGTDSHTTMVNGLGVVAWGVGGIEAEAGMLGQPVAFATPDVVGVHMSGALREGITATDLVLHITQMLRKVNVVGKFVEYHGEGAASLAATDRATIANMAPEYGATMGYFPVDERTLEYYRATGRSPEQVDAIRAYFEEQGMFGIPRRGQCDYSALLELDLGEVKTSLSGPKRPQDRIDLPDVPQRFREFITRPVSEQGYGKSLEDLTRRVAVVMGADRRSEARAATVAAGGGQQAPESAPPAAGASSKKNTSPMTEIEMMDNRPTPDRVAATATIEVMPTTEVTVGHGDVVIAAITSCTNTSNPGVMLAAALLAKKAVERGLRVPAHVKPSLAPGSRVVTEYYRKTGLQRYLDELGFNLVGYGCTTCIGNSGPLDPKLEEAIGGNDLVVASVLSGNRNFEARVHQSVKANFLASPPLVVAYALAGNVLLDFSREPIGKDQHGKDVFLRDLWPSSQEIAEAMRVATSPEDYRRLYSSLNEANPLWNQIQSPSGVTYEWDRSSTYIQEPPYFEDFRPQPGRITDIRGARLLAMFGDSITTDHISPAGSIKPTSPAGQYLIGRGTKVEEFNTYGARRGNHEVMVRGTFANVRIKNLLVPGVEGGVTIHQPSGERMSIYDAAMRYKQETVPLIIMAGEEYGTGSSRDWAAKGSQLLGVRAVIAQSFERIHRSNLIGMGVLPCQFMPRTDAASLGITGKETFDLLGLEEGLRPRQELRLLVHAPDGATKTASVLLRIDTGIELEYFRHGGILPFVLRQIAHSGQS